MDGNFSDYGDSSGRSGDSPREVLRMVVSTLMARRGGSADGIDAVSSEGFGLNLDGGRRVEVHVTPTKDLEVENFTQFLDMMLEELDYFRLIELDKIDVSDGIFNPRDPKSMFVDEKARTLTVPAAMFSRSTNEFFRHAVDTTSALGIVSGTPGQRVNRLVVDITMLAMARTQRGNVGLGAQRPLIGRERDYLSQMAARTSGVTQNEGLSLIARHVRELDRQIASRGKVADLCDQRRVLVRQLWPLVYAVGRNAPDTDPLAVDYTMRVREYRAFRYQGSPVENRHADFPFD
jgi:hypothetical protein